VRLAPHYLAGTPSPELDAAVVRLMASWPADLPEDVAVARACLVLQACEPTALLIEGALATGSLEAALRDRPPVPVLRREGVEIDVAPPRPGADRCWSSGMAGGPARAASTRWRSPKA
jgi:hypothetical protein